jgi:AraC-like DNA-binding protein
MEVSPLSRDAFLNLPKAELLEVFADFAGALGIAYQRCLLFAKPAHAHERSVICFPRGATRALSTLIPSGKELLNDASNAVVKAAGTLHTVRSLSTVYDDLAVFPSAELVERVAVRSGFGKPGAQRFLRFTGEVPRTPWLRELVEQFFQRRVAAGESAANCSFFEEEIVRELLSLVNRRDGDAPVEKSAGGEPGILGRAVGLLEANLFTPVSAADLARSCGTSVSTMNRLFKSHLKVTPLAYQRERRLEEARRLLQSDRELTVEQVAFLVGYESPSAFCRSYRRKYRASASRLD